MKHWKLVAGPRLPIRTAKQLHRPSIAAIFFRNTKCHGAVARGRSKVWRRPHEESRTVGVSANGDDFDIHCEP